MGRDVPFKPEKICDECGKLGAFDFMGDYFCPECCEKLSGEDGSEDNGEDDEEDSE